MSSQKAEIKIPENPPKSPNFPHPSIFRVVASIAPIILMGGVG